MFILQAGILHSGALSPEMSTLVCKLRHVKRRPDELPEVGKFRPVYWWKCGSWRHSQRCGWCEIEKIKCSNGELQEYDLHALVGEG